jgi:hypothetical protein
MYQYENGQCPDGELPTVVAGPASTPTPTPTSTNTPTPTPTMNSTEVAATASDYLTQTACTGPICTTPIPSPCLGPVCIPTATPTPPATQTPVSFPVDEFASFWGSGPPGASNLTVGLGETLISTGYGPLPAFGDALIGSVVLADGYNVSSEIVNSIDEQSFGNPTPQQMAIELFGFTVTISVLYPIALIFLP